MKIADVNIPNPVFSSNGRSYGFAFRLLCKEMGCGLVYTEMISAKGLFYGNENTKLLLEVDEKEHPVAVQILVLMQKLCLKWQKIEETDIDIIDINMGCPAPKIVKNNEGSALMRNPKIGK